MLINRRNLEPENTFLRYARIKIDQIKTIPVYSNKMNDEVSALAQSMKTCGQLQPLIVRVSGDAFELVAGERRYKAALIAGFKYVDVMILRNNDQSSLIISLAERISSKMHFFDEARKLREAAAAGLTYQRIAEATGIPQQEIAEKIRLLQLDNDLKEKIVQSNITETQAREVLNASEEERYNKLDEILHPPQSAPPLKISGLVRHGSILTQPILQVLDKLKESGVRFDLKTDEDTDFVQINIKLHKKITKMNQQE